MLIIKIKPYIELSSYSREEVRKLMGVSNNTISLWCSGKSRPTLEDAFKLSRLLGVSVEDLYDYREKHEE
ncbi:helix-turn-helix transcriptional regulator [Bacillus sp. V2I10]|uniref:helix-turn-helix transcriptional regulator n=1 Tax=Bacillus sp. V2I10 TaxID=3042276 RepID=UPI002780127B|nr:helix-turn-helix domain-containing protein [Bacillus sp. V2I10]MDQ0860913.1 putative transcriptional regulator [Bacillus sp. V2I10]